MALIPMINYLGPPNFTTKTAVETFSASGEVKTITSTGAYYAVFAHSATASGTGGFISLSSDFGDNTKYLAAQQNTENTAFTRVMTPWVYIPSGTVFYARAIFGTEGKVYRADPN